MNHDSDPLPAEAEEAVLRILAVEGEKRTHRLEEACLRHPQHAKSIRNWVASSSDENQERIGRFELQGEIGRGGMGVVYRAWDPELKREVALKVLHGWRSVSEELRARFAREARAIARLSHPGIVQIHDVGASEGTPYFAMELIEGRDLRSWLAESEGSSGDAPAFLHGPPDDRGRIHSAVCFVKAIGEALEHAHAQGVQHRDITPANILVSEGDRPKLLDFGLAKLQGEQTLTLTGSLAGTPAYVAPEVLAAGRIPIDHRADVYSLGVVLYELLVRRLPFEGETTQRVFKQILMDDPPTLRGQNRAIASDLEAVCLRALEKSPDRRYSTAEEMVTDLDAWLAGRTTSARPMGAWRRSWRLVRRQRVPWTSALVGALFAGIALWAWIGSKATPLPLEERIEPSVSEIVSEANSYLPQKPSIALALAGAAYDREVNAATRSCVLEAALSLAGNSEGGYDRSEPEAFLLPFARTHPTRTAVAALASDEAGARALILDEDGSLWSWILRENRTLQFASMAFPLGKVWLSSDGAFGVARGRNGNTALYRIPEGELVEAWSCDELKMIRAAATIVTIRRDERILTLRDGGGRVLFEHTLSPSDQGSDAPWNLLHADETKIVTSLGKELRTRDPGTGELRHRLELSEVPVLLEPFPDSKQLIVATRDSAIHIVGHDANGMVLVQEYAPTKVQALSGRNELSVTLHSIELDGIRMIQRASKDQPWRENLSYDPSWLTEGLQAPNLLWVPREYTKAVRLDSGLLLFSLSDPPTVLLSRSDVSLVGSMDGSVVAWRHRGLDPFVGRLGDVDPRTHQITIMTEEQGAYVFPDAPFEVVDKSLEFSGYWASMSVVPGGRYLFAMERDRVNLFDVVEGRLVHSVVPKESWARGPQTPEGFEGRWLGGWPSTSRIEGKDLVIEWGKSGSPSAFITRSAIATWLLEETRNQATLVVESTSTGEEPAASTAERISGLEAIARGNALEVRRSESEEIHSRTALPANVVVSGLSLDGSKAAAWTAGQIHIIDTTSGVIEHQIDLGREYRDPAKGHYSRPLGLAVSRNGSLLATLRDVDDGEILTLYDVDQDAVLWHLDTARIDGAGGGDGTSELHGFVCADTRLWFDWYDNTFLLPIDVDSWAEAIAFPEDPRDRGDSLRLGR